MTQDRRDFLKKLGFTAAGLSMARKTIGQTQDGQIVSAPEEYGEFLVESLDHDAYEVNPEILKAMPGSMTVFSRNGWDEARADRPREDIRNKNLVDGEGKNSNQTRLDWALNDGSWVFAHMGGRHNPYLWKADAPSHPQGKWDPADIDMNWKDASISVKHAALFYGASLAGAAKLNPLWIYSDHHAPTNGDRKRCIPVLADGERFGQTDDAWYIPKSMNRVIALAFEEDHHALMNSPGRLASAATGNGYSRMAFTAGCLAEFIRSLGYRAIPAGNGTGLSIPMAIDAGLGELGRNGLLVTPKYGPRVRIAKVITDMPLIADKPIRFGVTEFCEACMTCAHDCPTGSIPTGERTWEGPSPSNSNGTFKWYINPESCFDYNGFSCSNCKRNCPFTKPNNSWLHQMIRKVIEGKIKPLNHIMVTLDQASGYGQQISDSDFWKMDGSTSITAREDMK
ncbi:reductive dehalogenase [bacterium]|nr:reductive dehalogenase [bacterium]